MALKDFEPSVDLAVGGEASIQLAWCSSLQDWVVIKRAHDRLGRKRLQHEEEVLRHLAGCRTSQILAWPACPAGSMAQTWIRGVPLESLTAQDARSWLLAAAVSLEEIHARNVVHADLHGGNLLACSDGTVVLLDFGMSRWNGKAPDTSCGEWTQRAPEVLKGLEPEFAADVFAWGVLALRLLRPQHPLLKASRDGWLDGVLEGGPSREWEDFDQVVALALQPDPSSRPANGGALRRALEAKGWRMPLRHSSEVEERFGQEMDRILEAAVQARARLQPGDAWRFQQLRVEIDANPERHLTLLGTLARRQQRQKKLVLVLALVGLMLSLLIVFVLFRPEHPNLSQMRKVSPDSLDPLVDALSLREVDIPIAPPGSRLWIDGTPAEPPLNGHLLVPNTPTRLRLLDISGQILFDTLVAPAHSGRGARKRQVPFAK